MNIFNFLTPKSGTFYLDTDSTVRMAAEKFDYHKFSVVPVLDAEGRYVTTVSEGDILRYIKKVGKFDVADAEKVYIKDIEKYRPYTAADLRTPLDTIFKLSMSQNFVPVVDDRNAYIGIIKRRSIIEYLYNKQNNE